MTVIDLAPPSTPTVVTWPGAGGALQSTGDGQVLGQLFVGGNLNVSGLIVGKGAVPAGGAAGQALVKVDATDYNVTWGVAGMSQEQADARYLQLAGGTVGGQLNVSGLLNPTSTLSVGGKATFLGPSGGNTIAATPGGTFPVEIQSPGGGAAAMAFHRPGYYAAHFGLDTDNIWKVGGWSMGNASYTLWHAGNSVPTFSDTVFGAGYGVKRDGSGYLRTNYINMTADIQGGKPTYIVGMVSGDNFLRYWPASAIGPPALTEIIGTNSVSSFPDGTRATQLSYAYATRTGYWAFSHVLRFNTPSDNLTIDARFAGAVQFSQNWNPTNDRGGGLGGVAYLANGQALEIYGNHSYNGGYNILYQQLKMWFVPTSTYPG